MKTGTFFKLRLIAILGVGLVFGHLVSAATRIAELTFKDALSLYSELIKKIPLAKTEAQRNEIRQQAQSLHKPLLDQYKLFQASLVPKGAITLEQLNLFETYLLKPALALSNSNSSGNTVLGKKCGGLGDVLIGGTLGKSCQAPVIPKPGGSDVIQLARESSYIAQRTLSEDELKQQSLRDIAQILSIHLKGIIEVSETLSDRSSKQAGVLFSDKNIEKARPYYDKFNSTKHRLASAQEEFKVGTGQLAPIKPTGILGLASSLEIHFPGMTKTALQQAFEVRAKTQPHLPQFFKRAVELSNKVHQVTLEIEKLAAQALDPNFGLDQAVLDDVRERNQQLELQSQALALEQPNGSDIIMRVLDAREQYGDSSAVQPTIKDLAPFYRNTLIDGRDKFISESELVQSETDLRKNVPAFAQLGTTSDELKKNQYLTGPSRAVNDLRGAIQNQRQILNVLLNFNHESEESLLKAVGGTLITHPALLAKIAEKYGTDSEKLNYLCLSLEEKIEELTSFAATNVLFGISIATMLAGVITSPAPPVSVALMGVSRVTGTLGAIVAPAEALASANKGQELTELARQMDGVTRGGGRGVTVAKGATDKMLVNGAVSLVLPPMIKPVGGVTKVTFNFLGKNSLRILKLLKRSQN